MDAGGLAMEIYLHFSSPNRFRSKMGKKDFFLKNRTHYLKMSHLPVVSVPQSKGIGRGSVYPD